MFFTIHKCANGWIVRCNDHGVITESEIDDLHVFESIDGVGDYLLKETAERAVPLKAKK